MKYRPDEVFMYVSPPKNYAPGTGRAVIALACGFPCKETILSRNASSYAQMLLIMLEPCSYSVVLLLMLQKADFAQSYASRMGISLFWGAGFPAQV